MKDEAQSSASLTHGLKNERGADKELLNEVGERQRAGDFDNQQDVDCEIDDNDDELMPESSWLDPYKAGPSSTDESNGNGSSHARQKSFWAHSHQSRSQIIPQVSDATSHRDGRRRKGSSRRSPGGAGDSSSAAFAAAQALKRVSFELPLELTRIEDKDGDSGAAYRLSGGSKSRRLDFSTSAPVSRHLSASMHCQAGMKGTRTGFANTDLEIRYKPALARRDAVAIASDGNDKAGGIIRRSDATYTAGLSLTERPSLSVGATLVSISSQRERSTTWSWKLASPKLHPAAFTASTWWKGLSGRVGWSRDLSSFCTVRSSFALSLPKENGEARRVPLSSSQSPTNMNPTEHQMSGMVLHRIVQFFSSASVTLTSRNTLHKWSASLSWSPLSFPSIRRRGESGKEDAKQRDQQQLAMPLQRLSWQPRIALSLSPELPKALVDRACRVSGWYSLADSSWSVATTMSKTIRNTHVSVGWTRVSSGSWTYLITFSLGSIATIRIPVTVTAVLDPFWYPLQVGFASIVSGLIQEAVSHAFASPSSASTHCNGLDGGPRDESDALTSSRLRRQRARKLAENQQALMRRTAENRMRAELAKVNEQQRGGLVIDRAVYYTDRESWDVTIPLQFWVQDSVLDIGPATKKDLLGFYDLSYRPEPPSTQREAPAEPWISGFWRLRGDSEGSNGTAGDSSGGIGGGIRRRFSSALERVAPQLRIDYTFDGQSHQATFHDRDEILLPR